MVHMTAARPLLITPRSETIRVPHEDGGIAGIQTAHWDGRLDATVFARPVRVRMSLAQREEFMRRLRSEP